MNHAEEIKDIPYWGFYYDIIHSDYGVQYETYRVNCEHYINPTIFKQTIYLKKEQHSPLRKDVITEFVILVNQNP